MTMGYLKKCLRSGYQTCFVTSAYLARCARKLLRKTRRGKRSRRATLPPEPAVRPPAAPPSPTGGPCAWCTLQRAASVVCKAAQVEASKCQTEAVPAQSEAVRCKVVGENGNVHKSTDNLCRDAALIKSDDDFDSGDSDRDDTDSDYDLGDLDGEYNRPGADPDDSRDSDNDLDESDDSDSVDSIDSTDEFDDFDDSDSEDSTDSGDYNDLDDSQSEDSSAYESDDDTPFRPVQTNFQNRDDLKCCYFPADRSNEDGTDSEENESRIEEEKQKARVKSHLPDLSHHGNDWLVDDLSSDDSDVIYDSDGDYDYDHLDQSPPFQPVGVQWLPDVPAKTQIEPIAVLDAADFVDPPGSRMVLGRGAFGEVTLRYQLSTGRWVAYKTLLGDTDRDNVIFEGQAMRLLSNHASFPKVYGVVIRDGHRALVAEFLGDELTAQPLTLTDALRGEHPLELPRDEWCQIALDIVDGVRYMHRCNLLHMDVKSDNILLVEGNDRWSARIIDFGECRQSPVSLVLSLVVKSDRNTPLQGLVACKVHWTTCSDVYGVGETLCLIGRHGNVPLLEEGGAEVRKTSLWCSGYIEHPKIEEVRVQLLHRGKSLPAVGY